MTKQTINKKEIKEALDKVLENATGAKVWFSDPEGKQLYRLLKEISDFKSALRTSNHFKVKSRSHRGRRYKVVAIERYNGSNKLVTKTMIANLGKKFNKRNAVIKGLRELIEPQIQEFRERNALWEAGKSHIDHKITFISLACDWVIERGWNSFEDVPGKKRGNKWEIELSTSTSWIVYHKENAELRVVDAHINLSEGAKNYSPPF